MDIQLQELINKIKKDGVASAESSAAAIIAEAEKKAASIISDAEAKADSILKTAKTETERMEKASEDAIAQAGRNLIISFRDGINKEVNAIVSAETERIMDKDLLKKLIPEAVKAWAAKNDASDLSILLAAKDLKALESSIKSALKGKLAKGLEIKADASLSSGFRIGAKDGSAFYDFSADEVAGLFSAYLNPKTTELMKKAAAGIQSSPAENAETKDAPKEAKEETAVKVPARRGRKPASEKGTK